MIIFQQHSSFRLPTNSDWGAHFSRQLSRSSLTGIKFFKVSAQSKIAKELQANTSSSFDRIVNSPREGPSKYLFALSLFSVPHFQFFTILTINRQWSFDSMYPATLCRYFTSTFRQGEICDYLHFVEALGGKLLFGCSVVFSSICSQSFIPSIKNEQNA